MGARMKRVAATEQKAAHADGTSTTAGDGHAVGSQGPIDISPVCARTNRSNLSLLVIGGGVEET